MAELTKIEEILLLSIWRLKDSAYGVLIRKHVSHHLKKDFTYGNLYSALNQMVKKKYVVKKIGDSTEERQGRRRIYYTLSPLGVKALREARALNEALWKGIPDEAF